MDAPSYLRMEWFEQTYLAGGNTYAILDVGSYDVNGTYREIFADSRYHYTGLDMQAGPNVDIVPANSYIWREIENDSYDVVISGQVFEHVEFFWITMAEIARVLRPGGLTCIIAPRGFEFHRFPVDCYRFDVDGMVALARYCNLTPLHASTNRAPSQDMSEWYSINHHHSMLVAKKPDNWAGMLDLETYKLEPPDIEALATGMVRMKKPEKLKRRILRKFGYTKKYWDQV